MRWHNRSTFHITITHLKQFNHKATTLGSLINKRRSCKYRVYLIDLALHRSPPRCDRWVEGGGVWPRHSGQKLSPGKHLPAESSSYFIKIDDTAVRSVDVPRSTVNVRPWRVREISKINFRFAYYAWLPRTVWINVRYSWRAAKNTDLISATTTTTARGRGGKGWF